MLHQVRSTLLLLGKIATFFTSIVIVTVVFLSVSRQSAKIDSVVQRVSLEKSNQQYEAQIAKEMQIHQVQYPLMTALTQEASCSLVGMLCDLDASVKGSPIRRDSVAGFASRLIALPFKYMPASGSLSLQQTLAHAGVIPQAHAQGIGFGALAPFQSVWKVMRDFSYLAIVLIAVIVGFMVMFQVGSDSKAGVTLEATLPRIVFVLIAISLSYALAGFLVDVMYITIIFVVYLLAPAAGLDPAGQKSMLDGILSGVGPSSGLFTYMFQWSQFNYWSLGDSLWTLVPEQLQAMVLSLMSTMWTRLLWVFVGGSTQQDSSSLLRPYINRAKGLRPLDWSPKGLIQTLLAKGVAAPLQSLIDLLGDTKGSGSGTWAVSTIAALVYFVIYSLLSTLISTVLLKLILFTILILTVFWIMVRITFFLFKVYTEIIINIFLAPVFMLADIVPGQNMFISWIKGLLTNLMIFPMVVVFFLIVRILVAQSSAGGSIWAPPFLASMTDMGSFIMIVAGFLLYMIPELLEAFKEKVGGKSSLPFSASPGVFFSGVAPIITMGASFIGASGIGKALANQVSEPAANFASKTASKLLGMKMVEKVKQDS